MLSDLLKDKHRFIILKDDLGEERLYGGFFEKLLQEQNVENDRVKCFDHYNNLQDVSIWMLGNRINTEEKCENKQWNIIMPPFSDLLAIQNPPYLMQFLNKLKKYRQIQRVLLWITPENCNHEHSSYLIAGVENMADMVIHLKTPTHLTITKCRSNGGVSIKNYSYKRSKNEFSLKLIQKYPTNREESAKMEKLEGTFKIELDEEELVARNALRLPYEKLGAGMESNITYIPDARDDIDEEDPDDDLCI